MIKYKVFHNDYQVKKWSNNGKTMENLKQNSKDNSFVIV